MRVALTTAGTVSVADSIGLDEKEFLSLTPQRGPSYSFARTILK